MADKNSSLVDLVLEHNIKCITVSSQFSLNIVHNLFDSSAT